LSECLKADLTSRVVWKKIMVLFFIKPFYCFIFFISNTPVWVFLVPLTILAIICIRFWKKKGLRVVCIILFLLIAIPFLWIQIYVRTGGDGRFQSIFGNAITTNNITKYRYCIAGFLETEEYWKLNKIDTNKCKQVIQELHLEKRASNNIFPPGSLGYAPWWWPKSPKDYSIFEGDDGYFGSIEIWIPIHASGVYFYKFTD
jgi:energy-coupling factor transporter transmembrane protein EcfT